MLYVIMLYSNNDYIYCTHAVESASAGDTSLQCSTRETSPEASPRDDDTTSEMIVLPEDGTQETPAHNKGAPQKDDLLQGPSSSKDHPSDGLPNSKRIARRKRQRPVDLEKVVADFDKHQKESWERFMEWEEKRMKIEAEEEAKRREEQRRHEMELFSMLANMLHNRPGWQPQEDFQQYPNYYDQH